MSFVNTLHVFFVHFCNNPIKLFQLKSCCIVLFQLPLSPYNFQISIKIREAQIANLKLPVILCKRQCQEWTIENSPLKHFEKKKNPESSMGFGGLKRYTNPVTKTRHSIWKDRFEPFSCWFSFSIPSLCADITEGKCSWWLMLHGKKIIVSPPHFPRMKKSDPISLFC